MATQYPFSTFAEFCDWLIDAGIVAAQSEENMTIESQLLNAVKMAYRKHCLDDDTIGWGELSDILQDALCSAMPASEYQAWFKSVTGTRSDG